MNSFWHRLTKPFTVLAPMEDVTDAAFRRVVLEAGRPDVFYTEFTSCEGLCSEGREAVSQRLRFCEAERPIVAQVWGKEPEAFCAGAALLREMGFDGIDINMGCPVAKIVRGGACARLIENHALAREIFLAAREGAGPVPLSIKTRIGFRRVETEEWVPFLLQLNPEALVVHGRVAKHLSKFPADWEEIGKAVRLRDEMKKETVIIGNGDVTGLAEAREKHEKFGVDGVMVGRGIFQNLFLFNRAEGTRPFRELPPAERLGWMLRHAALFAETWGPQRDFGVLKKFFKIYVSNFKGASELRARLMQTESVREVEEIIRDFCGA